MSIDPETFRQMFAASESQSSDEFELRSSRSSELVEPPIRGEEPPLRGSEPPIRVEVPPPSKQEIEDAAAEQLLMIAAEEEKDLQNVRKALRSRDTFLITCPNGCRIRVKEQHRGRSGKYPRCQSDFIVPKKSHAEKDKEVQ